MTCIPSFITIFQWHKLLGVDKHTCTYTNMIK